MTTFSNKNELFLLDFCFKNVKELIFILLIKNQVSLNYNSSKSLKLGKKWGVFYLQMFVMFAEH